MDTSNIERYLKSFGSHVVEDSKKLLKAAKGSTALGSSIRFKVEKTATGFSTKFYMDDYGTFLDKGVSGNKKKQSFKDYKGKRMSSPYKYTTKQPPTNILAKWISKKGIKGRDKKTGRFISHMSLAFIIGRKIKRDGIKSLAFFQKPLGLGMKQFSAELLGNVKEDLIETLNETITTVN